MGDEVDPGIGGRVAGAALNGTASTLIIEAGTAILTSMQELSHETEQFLADLQAYAGRPLNFPRDVGQLLDMARGRHLEQVFRDAIFHAKFAVKSREVMSRIGAGADGFDKLSTEFQNSVEKTSALLKTIVKESPDEIKQHFVSDFFALDQSSFGNFNRLLEDLGWVKNWEVDGKPMPLKTVPVSIGKGNDDAGGEKGKVRISAIVGLALMIALLMFDPPASYLGWSVAIVVDLLLMYIAIASHTTKKT